VLAIHTLVPHRAASGQEVQVVAQQPNATLLQPSIDASRQHFVQSQILRPDGSVVPWDTAYIPLFSQAGDVPTLPTARVAIDVRNVRIDAALKRLFTAAGQSYELDRGIPADTRVTLRVKNISFATALQALLEQVDLGWTIQNVTKDKRPAALYRIAKQSSSLRLLPLGAQMDLQPIPWMVQSNILPTIPWTEALSPVLIDGLQATRSPNWLIGGPGNNPHYQILATPTYQNSAKGQSGLLSPPPDISSHGADHETIHKIPILGDLPIMGSLFTTRTRSEHSIFTCPHCHQQVTVVRAHETPTCSECGRAFQTDWKVCPFDGTKRPVVAGEWRFCPICGKPLGAALAPGRK